MRKFLFIIFRFLSLLLMYIGLYKLVSWLISWLIESKFYYLILLLIIIEIMKESFNSHSKNCKNFKADFIK